MYTILQRTSRPDRLFIEQRASKAHSANALTDNISCGNLHNLDLKFNIRIHVFKAGHPDIFAFAKNTPAKRPKSMLNRFSKLVGTLNSKIPATERGILFSDPTKLYVVGPV